MHKVIVSSKEPHYSDEPLHFTNASLQYSNLEQECIAQICVVYHACSLPPFASSYYRLLEQKVPAGYNGHMHKMCLHWDHTYVQTFVQLWGYMHVSIALACIFKVILITQYNTQYCMNGEADNPRF